MFDPETTVVGQVHALPDSEKELPAGKKPRMEVLDVSELEAGASRQYKNKDDRRNAKKERKRKATFPEPCSSEDVLWQDVISVLGREVVDQAVEDGVELQSPFKYHEEVEVEVKTISSNGEGIAVSPEGRRPWAIVVPLALPGEKIRVRTYRQGRLHSYGDLLEVITPNAELRDDSRAQCKYFGSCAGCQYQMLSYDTQLDLKRDVVVKAYRNYSKIPEPSMPQILSTIPSPLQYAYRTKLTPHFDAPPKSARKGPRSTEKPDWLNIGFNRIGAQSTMDIEDCPIATPVINESYGPMREDIIKNIYTYKKGVSLLFRDSLDTSIALDPDSATSDPVDRLSEAFNRHICVTDQKGTVREKVGDWVFEYNGGSFFQNNNSVLLPLTNYVRDAIFPPTTNTTATPACPTHLVDTYCGSGLFAIVLSPHFDKVAGIELSADSIRYATRNAKLNNVPEEKISFRSGNAGEIFATVRDFPADDSVVLIDPPRKGCDEFFIQQLLEFAPRTIVYVSCNVHTQARDVGSILRATGGNEVGKKYVLESVRGFDLFPQTAHVESVAFLRRV